MTDMTLPRLLPAASAALLGVAGALTSVGVARAGGPYRVPVDQLSLAVVITAYAVAALLVTAARPDNRVGRLMVIGTGAWGLGEGLLALGLHKQSSDLTAWFVSLGTTSRALGWLLLVLAVPLVFPDGRPPWANRRWPTALTAFAIAAFTLGALLAPTPLDRRAAQLDSPTGLPDTFKPAADALALLALVACVAALVVAIAGLAHRWRSGDTLRQQQLLWLALAFAPPVLFLPLIATHVAQPWLFALVTLPVPIAVAVAILQRRLYDIQMAFARTLTYVALSASVAAVYVVTVASVGAVLDERGAAWLSWLAAGVVAVSFAPLRNALQQAVNRFTFGHWAEPAEVLGATTRRLADATDVPGLLKLLVEELTETLRLSRVEIHDTSGRLLAASGQRVSPLTEDPLTAYGTPVGTLRWATDRDLRDADRRLLGDVANQLGGIVHSAALVERLRDSQHRLVLAREEERRRLRRELHDGLGPALASLGLKVDELRNRWQQLDHPDTELLKLRSMIQETVTDVRRIVEGLRPAQLDHLGLEAAVEQLGAKAPHTDVSVNIQTLPALPAAVEVATFRVVQEALTNALRHAAATSISIKLDAAEGWLVAEVTDDGVGGVAPRPGGLGVSSMHARAEELGGRLSIQSEPTRGTAVRLELPLDDTNQTRTSSP